ncbi:DUF6998 domain-containing protein [Devosia sp. A16]|uniref:DUF6998 domain-containing protein n=1 Tax=Devosia sp. A16 TaxID=1736675 RepID=UPI0009EA9F64|nr:hypothetical protein [Devosia sp. A16]
MSRHKLPEEIRHLVHARNALRTRYGAYGLKFTPDGNLVGDLGEAVCAELFGLTLAPRRGLKAIDAYTTDGQSVQIKASGRGTGIPFTHSEEPAVWLLVVCFDYEAEEVEVVYNGPYAPAVARLPPQWAGQKAVRVSFLRRLNSDVEPGNRLPILPLGTPTTLEQVQR